MDYEAMPRLLFGLKLESMYMKIGYFMVYNV